MHFLCQYDGCLVLTNRLMLYMRDIQRSSTEKSANHQADPAERLGSKGQALEVKVDCIMHRARCPMRKEHERDDLQ